MLMQKIKIHQWISLGLVATSFSILAGCQSPTASTSASPEATTTASPEATTAANNTAPQATKATKVSLSWLLQGIDAPFTMALKQGYFTEAGLDVSFERGYGSADSVTKIAAGQYDIGFGDVYSMIEFNEKNPDQKLIAVAIPFNKAPFAIASLKKSGITTPQDLVGKKIGAPVGDAPRRLWPIFAKEIGIDPESVTWVTMEPKLRETFLLQGQVDAISGFSSSMIPALLKGGTKMEDIQLFYYSDNGLDLYGNTIIVREAVLKENPEMVKAFLAAYLKGMQDVIKDPNAGLESVMAAGDKLMSKDAEKLRLEIALDRLFITPEAEANGLGDIDPERMKATIEQAVSGFGLAKTPAIEEVFTAEFLPAKNDRMLPPAAERKTLN